MAVVAAFAVPHPPLILHEVGKGEERKIQSTIDAYRLVMRQAAEYQPDTIVVASPHATIYSDYFHISPGASASGSFIRFGVAGLKVDARYDEQLVEAITRQCEREHIAAGTDGELTPSLDHATMIPLCFLNEVTTDYKLVRVGLSGMSPIEHYRLGMCIALAADRLDRRGVFIASGDLSHKLKESGSYGFSPDGPRFDKEVTQALGKGDFLSLLRFPREMCENAAECGLRSFQIMAGVLDGRAISSRLLSYEGPFGVGYCVAAFEASGSDKNRRFLSIYEHEEKQKRIAAKKSEDAYVRLARMTIEGYIHTGHMPTMPDNLPDEMLSRRAGAFVSLKKEGRLRGCIGTIAPTARTVAQEIMQNAVSAATRDPRFDPLGEDELDELVYSVDVLSDAERVDSPDMLDVKRFGVIVQKDSRRGLLLPDLEGVDTVAVQIAIAKQKAGILPDESVDLWRFEVVRHR